MRVRGCEASWETRVRSVGFIEKVLKMAVYLHVCSVVLR